MIVNIQESPLNTRQANLFSNTRVVTYDTLEREDRERIERG